MSDFSKFKIGSTSYNVKDANAGRSLSVSGSDLSLKNANGTAISTVTLPSGGNSGYVGFMLEKSYNVSPENFNHTSISVSDIDWGAYDSSGQWYDKHQITLADFIQRALNMPSGNCGFHYLSSYEYWFTLKSIKRDDNNYLDCTFELKLESSYVAQIILKVDSTGSFISCYGEKVSFSGGGGGSTLKELTVQDDYGQPIRVSDFLNGGSGMVLYDNDRAAGITDDQLLSDFNSGEVLIHVGPSYEMEKMHFKLDGYSVAQANRVYGWVYDNGKKLALFEYSGNKKWILQIIT